MIQPTPDILKRSINKSIFHVISKIADAQNMKCYIVGGYVRDLILERPSKDVDIVVIGSGITIAKALKDELGDKAFLSVFKKFGTAQVKIHGEEYEFVGARKESYSHDSRKPIVEEGTLEDDQNRRDFTINAMAIALNSSNWGEFIDPFDGLLDLRDGIISTPLDPNITFSDDPLRMMRCIRFSTQLNFMIEEETFKALEDNKERIKIISAERIIDELNKIMMTPTPSKGFVDLQRCGLLEIFFPELSNLDIVESKNGKKYKNNFYHSLEVLDNVSKNSDNLWLRWAALIHDIGKPLSKSWVVGIGWAFHNHNYLGMKMVKPLFKRLKLPMNHRMKYVEKLVLLHMRPISIADDQVTDSAVRRLLFDAGDDIDDLMLLCDADITSKNEVRKKRFRDNFKLVRKKLVTIEEKDRIRNFQPPIDGNEIMKMYHLGPCKEVGGIKKSLKDAILDGKISNNYEEGLAFVKMKAKELGLVEENQ